MSTSTDYATKLFLTISDLESAKEDAARHLSHLRETQQAVRDARADFERARRTVKRHEKRRIRLIHKGETK